jgi:hypothetical protein
VNIANHLCIYLPRLHVAGWDAHHDAHIEVGPHRLALSLSPEADYPVVDIDGMLTALEEPVGGLRAAVDSRQITPDK